MGLPNGVHHLAICTKDIKGQIEFSGVTFKYKGAVSPALNDLSFEIPMGGTLGVMGKSGSGSALLTTATATVLVGTLYPLAELRKNAGPLR